MGAPHLPSPGDPCRRRQPLRLRAPDPGLRGDRRGRRMFPPWPPHSARCSWLRAAAGSGCSPPSPGCRRCTRASPPRWRRRASRCWPSTWTQMDNATLVDVFRTEEEFLPAGHRRHARRRRRARPCAAPGGVRAGALAAGPTSCTASAASTCPAATRAASTTPVARLRLRQAFGRLIRAADDRGVFVLLDRRAPSRLLSALAASGVDGRSGWAWWR